MHCDTGGRGVEGTYVHVPVLEFPYSVLTQGQDHHVSVGSAAYKRELRGKNEPRPQGLIVIVSSLVCLLTPDFDWQLLDDA